MAKYDNSRQPNRYHRDGTVTYWSVYHQQWIRRARTVPARELAAMCDDEREKVQRHTTRAALAEKGE